MTAKLLQKHGLKPIILLGTATSLMGDPSGKTAERALLDEESMAHNAECIKNQLMSLLDFDSTKENGAIMVSNNDWMKEFSFVQFARDVCKHLTVNYMLAKESIKQRISREGTGISITEFLYELFKVMISCIFAKSMIAKFSWLDWIKLAMLPPDLNLLEKVMVSQI